MASWQKKALGTKSTFEPSLVASVSCFCFNGDKSCKKKKIKFSTVIALSPNDNTVQIYETQGSTDTTKWVKKWELKEHTKLVMDIDWAVKSNQILTAGQDRNAYVWTMDGNEWKPSLVLLKIHRSATSCRWSVNEDKVRNFKKNKQKVCCWFRSKNSFHLLL
jgi:actin related protein 2/3 complex, subunit 1A/1B